MDHIVLNQAGALRSDYFFQFEVPFDDEFPSFYPYPEHEWVVSRRTPTLDEIRMQDAEPWLEVAAHSTEEDVQRQCPRDPTHITERHWRNVRVGIRRGKRLSEFIPLDQEVPPSRIVIVSAPFAARLRATGLTGFRVDSVEVWARPGRKSDLKLFLLQFEGKNCHRPFSVRGAPNACPYCGYKPVICPACGEQWSRCPKCGEGTWTTRTSHNGAGDRRLIIAPPENRGTPILEGKRWDGSDFVIGRGYQFLTKRALDWLLSVHAAPFQVHSVRVNVEGMSEEQLAQLKRAQELSSLSPSKASDPSK